MRKHEAIDPKDFFDYSKEVRDAAENIYDAFNRTIIKNILSGRNVPSNWNRLVRNLSAEDAIKATELAFSWAAEDSMSQAKFPENFRQRKNNLKKEIRQILSKKQEKNIESEKGVRKIKMIEIKEEVRIPGTNVILEKGDKIKILEKNWNYDQEQTIVRNTVRETRIVMPNEKAHDMHGRIIRPGDIVDHYKFGRGQIQAIDTSTYSIPFISVELFDDKYEGEVIYKDATSFEKRG